MATTTPSRHGKHLPPRPSEAPDVPDPQPLHELFDQDEFASATPTAETVQPADAPETSPEASVPPSEEEVFDVILEDLTPAPDIPDALPVVTEALPEKPPDPAPATHDADVGRGAATRLTAVGSSGIEGVPGQYNDGTEWLRNGITRHRTALVVSLIAGWTGIWVAAWGAAFGLVVGALAAGGLAFSAGSSLGVGQAAGALGVIAGGFLGLVAGFVAVVRFLILHRPLQAVASVASGAVLAFVVVILGAAYERLGLRLRGYRRLSRAEVRRIAPLVKQASDAMGLSALPRFAMADVLVPNAYTHMRTVVLTTGLLQTMSDDELRAVLVHELEHWRHGDSVGARFVWAAALPVALAYNLGALLIGRGARGGPPAAVMIRGVRALVGWFVAFPAWVIIKFVITPLTMTAGRSYEYEADAAAYRVGFGADLSSALRKMGAFESGRTGWEQAMAATHPPTELRLEALEPPQTDDWEYQEGNLSAPTRDEIRRLLSFWRRRSADKTPTHVGA